MYGFVARGTQPEDSDVDIMVLVDGTDAQFRNCSFRRTLCAAQVGGRYGTEYACCYGSCNILGNRGL